MDDKNKMFDFIWDIKVYIRLSNPNKLIFSFQIHIFNCMGINIEVVCREIVRFENKKH